MQARYLWILPVLPLLSAVFAAPTPVRAAVSEPAAAEVRLDLTELDHLPVYYRGRVMPWQTLARRISDQLTGREQPRVNLKTELVHEDYASRKMRAARGLISGGERRFEASEALLSWVVEPQVWEDIPFILAEHDDLRDVLGLPHNNADNVKLRYVAPRQVAEQLEQGTELHALLDSIRRKQQRAMEEQGEMRLTGLEQHASDLWRRYSLYRQVSSLPGQGGLGRGNFISHATQSMTAWSDLIDEFRKMGHLGAMFGMSETMESVEDARQKIAQAAASGQVATAAIEPAVVQYKQGAQELAARFRSQRDRLLAEPPQFDELSPEEARRRLNTFMGLMTKLASDAKQMAIHANEMHIALYDDGDSVRVVPALNPAALDRERDTDLDSQPWISLNMLRFGSPQVLEGYPETDVRRARAAFDALAAAYTNRDEPRRGELFAEASENLARQFRQLGREIDALRDSLPIPNRDEDLLAYTAYPEAGATRSEVRYNRLDPFLWTWVICLLALLCFALSFGAVRKPMFLLGMAVTTFCIGWAIYGFALRVLVTQWAPVTNMFETVVYVPLFVLVLGLWFLTTPITWQGLAASWRLSAIPGTWEADPLSDGLKRLMTQYAWSGFGMGMIVPRVAMMGFLLWLIGYAPVYDGGEVIFHFVPQIQLSQLLLNTNALIVYLVTLACAAATVWFGPRLAIAAVASAVLIPLSLRQGRLRKGFDEMLGRKGFALAATVTGTFFFLVAWYASSMATGSQRVLNEEFQPLQPVLRSNFWLTVHVVTIVSSYSAGFLAWMLGVFSMVYYLFGKYRAPEGYSERAAWKAAAESATGGAPAGDGSVRMLPPRPPEPTAKLASYCYKSMQVAVLLLAAGTILGGLWADVSWGRFWGWDPKEVFALVSLLIYLVILHGRFAGWTGNFGTALGANLGAWSIIFAWYGVNFVLGVGLHSYGFGAGGQWEVGMFVFGNFLFVVAAAARYLIEMRRTYPVHTELAKRPVVAEAVET